MSFTEQMRAEIMEDFRRYDIPAILADTYTAPLPDECMVIQLARPRLVKQSGGCRKHGTAALYPNGRCRTCQAAATARYWARRRAA